MPVTKRRSSWACIGNPQPEQETIEGTHAQETPAYQRRPTTLHPVQGSNPPIRALYMQRVNIPHTCVLHLCYKETRWLGRHKQSITRAGSHQRHTRTINASTSTQAKNPTRATNGNHPARPLHMHLTNTPHTHHTASCATES